MFRERLEHWCDRGILVIVLAILAFGALATGAVRPLEFLVVQALTSAAIVVWLFRLWLSPKPRILWPPICWAVTAFVIYAIVRYRQADIEYVARQELIRILVYASLFFVVLNNLARQESTQTVSFALIFLAMAVSMYAIYQFATNSAYVWHFIKPVAFQSRGSGTYINPNHLAGFLEMLAPLGLAYAFTGRLGHLLRVFLGYASVIILAGIGVTISRGGWVATGVALALFFAWMVRRRSHRIPAVIVLGTLTAAGVFFYSKADRVQKRLDNVLSADSADSAQIRLWLWRPALQIWKDHFWLGAGPGHFDYRFPAYRPLQVQARPGHAHNDYVNTLADWGVVGTVLVTLCWCLLFFGVFKTWGYVRREPNDLAGKGSNRAAFVCGATIGLIAILVHSFFDFNMHIPANAMVAVTLMALLSQHLRFATDRHTLNMGRTGQLLVTVIGLVAIAYLAQQGLKRAREYAWLEPAAKEKTYSPTLISALKTAAEIDPTNFETTYSIGEALRQLSWQGSNDYEKLALEAIRWFQEGIHLNPYDAYNYMKLGMCLDWVGKHTEAAPYFEESVKRDPNNYYVVAHQGWHFLQAGDYAAAKFWFERSIRIKWWANPIPYEYLAIIERKLKETPAPAAR